MSDDDSGCENDNDDYRHGGHVENGSVNSDDRQCDEVEREVEREVEKQKQPSVTETMETPHVQPLTKTMETLPLTRGTRGRKSNKSKNAATAKIKVVKEKKLATVKKAIKIKTLPKEKRPSIKKKKKNIAEATVEEATDEFRNNYICADNQDVLHIARQKACTLIEHMEKSKHESIEEPVYFLSFLEDERNNHALEMTKAREALCARLSSSCLSSSSVSVVDETDITDRTDGRPNVRARVQQSYDHEISLLLREETRFANLVQRFETYYTERDYTIRESEIIEAFRRESNQTSKDTQLVFCTDKDHCQQCRQPYVYSADESTLFCTTCSYSSMYIDAKPSAVAYGDQIEFSSFSYKRINHFSEYSNHLQARESKQIPRAVLRQVMEILFTKLDITDYKKIDFLDVRNALKIMGARAYYDHVMQAWSRITGRVPLRLEPAVEELMHLMFAKIQHPWIKHRPHERKNFLSYPYVFYKFCQLLGFHEMLKYFPLLKGKVKLWQQEKTFKKICVELGWPWVPIENLEDELDELMNGMGEGKNIDIDDEEEEDEDNDEDDNVSRS